MSKKLFICLIAALCCNQVTKSQENNIPRAPKLGIGAEAILGDTKYGTGYFLNFQSPISQNLNWTVTLEKTNLQSTLKVMPKRKYKNFVTKVGGKYFLNKQFYISGDIGLAFDQIQRKKTSFAWSPGIGMEINTFRKSTLDIGTKYEVYQSAASIKFVALKIALNLGL